MLQVCGVKQVRWFVCGPSLPHSQWPVHRTWLYSQIADSARENSAKVWTQFISGPNIQADILLVLLVLILLEDSAFPPPTHTLTHNMIKFCEEQFISGKCVKRLKLLLCASKKTHIMSDAAEFKAFSLSWLCSTSISPCSGMSSWSSLFSSSNQSRQRRASENDTTLGKSNSEGGYWEERETWGTSLAAVT